jgi:effector-binding domain-containing protein
MAFQIELKQQAAQPVLSVRSRTTMQDLPGFLGKSFGAVAAYLGELGQAPAGAPFAAYHNMDMANLDVEAGFPVAQAAPARGEIAPSAIPGGQVATCLYSGPYDTMPPAYEALTQFIKEKGCEPTGVAYEIYLNDPATVSPQDLQTLILFPLKNG